MGESPPARTTFTAWVMILNCLALAGVLVVAAAWVGVGDAVFETDEGALIMQARQLSDERTWWIDYALAEDDPDGRFFPILNSAYKEGQALTLRVRPVLVTATAALWSVGGLFAATLLGIAGVVTAALTTSAVARRIDAGAALPTFWLTGLGSPLAFDALSLRGHGAVVGLTGLALYFAVRCLEPPARSRHAAGAAMFAALVVATLVRSEAAILAVALAGGLLVHHVRDRSLEAWRLALVAAAGGAVGVLLDRLLVAALAGDAVNIAPSTTSQGLVAERVDATVALFLPGYFSDPLLPATLILAAAAAALWGASVYVTRGDPGALTVGMVTAAALLGIRMVVAGEYLVRGLFPAFPIGLAGFVLGAVIRTPLIRLLAVTSGIYLVGIAATQYPVGGGIEWASRYTFAGLPFALVVIGVGLTRAATATPRTRLPSILVVAVTLVALLPTVMALSAQRSHRAENASNLEQVDRLRQSLGSRFVAMTHFEVGRTDTDQFATGTPLWVWARGGDIVELLDLVGSRQREPVPVVTREPSDVIRRLDGSNWRFEVTTELPMSPDEVYLGVARRADS